MAAILSIEACINQNLAAICTGQSLHDEYLVLLFQTAYESLREDGRGGQQAALNCQLLSAMRIPVPPPDEQNQIIQFIETELLHFRALEEDAVKAVSLLQERRSALISAAVTGKIDVRKYKRDHPQSQRRPHEPA